MPCITLQVTTFVEANTSVIIANKSNENFHKYIFKSLIPLNEVGVEHFIFPLKHEKINSRIVLNSLR